MLLIACLITCIVFFSCATTSRITGIDGLSLDEAIEQSAFKVIEELPSGARVAIVAFSSEHNSLSNYIMDELTGVLIDRGLEVADRRNLVHIYRELNFQMSGDVSDETAASIGKFMGARYVITGQFIKAGGRYRYRLSGINVETAVQESSIRLYVNDDRSFQRLLADVKQTPVITEASDYGIRQSTQTKTAGTYLDRGILFASRGDFKLAIDEFTKAINLDSELAAAWLFRGRALSASVSNIVEIFDDFSDFTYITGNITPIQQSAYDRAITDINQAIRINPNLASAYKERGNVYHIVGNDIRAISDFNQAIRLDPNLASAYAKRGHAYFRQGNYDRSIADYNQAIKLDPNNAEAYYGRAFIFLLNGDYNRAITEINQTIKLTPNNWAAWGIRGNAYYSKSDYDRAIADYSQGIMIDPTNSGVRYNNRGNAYFAKGDYNRAIADYEMALRTEPNSDTFKKNLENARRVRGW